MQATPSQTPVAAPKIARGHSCVLCQQRKVRCDRQKPCANCVKARVECAPSLPTVPRRKRRKFSELDVTTRLRRYEHLLKKNGIKIEDDEESHTAQQGRGGYHAAKHGQETQGGNPEGLRGRRPSDTQRTYYGEKYEPFLLRTISVDVGSTLWDDLRDEITEDPKEIMSSDEETVEREIYPHDERLFLIPDSAPKDLSSLHPQPVHIFRLWQTYLVNCNPLLKLFHAPTMQQTILEASSDLHNVPRHIEALMFSIYLLAVSSLSNQECEGIFNESRNDLLMRFSHGTQQALINARFLKSLNLSTLHAFCIYLLSLRRRTFDHHALWILTGCAVRIAVRLGIQHEGAAQKIPPFEAEIRRRTWWQIVFLDGQATKLAGAGFPTWLQQWDTKVPLNVSDSDLSPTMKEIPTEKEGATEMIFVRLRGEVGLFIRKLGRLNRGTWQVRSDSTTMAEKDKAIDELEARFQQKYIRFCDPSIPLHQLCIYMTKSVVCHMRLEVHHPRQYPDKGASMSPQEKDMLWAESLKELEIHTMGQLDKSVQGFRWHTHVQFHLDALIYVLSELRVRTTGDLVERGWRQIETAYDYRPEMITAERNTLYFAMGNLCLKAWRAFEEAGGRCQGSQLLPTPRYISMLRAQRKVPEPAPPLPPQQQPTPENGLEQVGPYTSTNQILNNPSYSLTGYTGHNTNVDQWDKDMLYMSVEDVTSVDWAYWQTLMDGDLPTFTGEPTFDADSLQGWIG